MAPSKHTLRLEAAATARCLVIQSGRTLTTALSGPFGTAALPASDHAEFALTVDGVRLTSHEFTPGPWTAGADGRDLRAIWRLDRRDLQVTVTYRAVPELGVVRKWLAVAGRGDLTSMELDSWPAPGAQGPSGEQDENQVGMGPAGLGQPLFWNGFFIGIEHPAAENWVAHGTLVCRLPCRRQLTAHPTLSPPCVIGAATRPGLEATAFRDYLDLLRPGGELPFVTLINNWYQFGRVRHRKLADLPGSAVLEEMRAFVRRAAAEGLTLDFYCLDDPWAGPGPDAGLWGALDATLFPGGLASLQAAAAPMRVGLWIGPLGGYLGRGPLVSHGKLLGFETWTDTADASGFGQEKLCAHATRYHAHLRDAMTRWARAGVRYWKFDGVDFTCTNPAHGHATGPGSRTEQIDAWIALMQAIRTAAPDSVITFTTGSNPSPWWLPHVDFVWRGGHDDRTTATNAPKRERFTTYIDACLDHLRTTRLPLAAVAAFGMIQNAAVSYADPAETPAAFERFLWHMVGRGSHHHDLYLSPDSLDAAAWACLTRVLAWARDHRRLLARSRMVLGHPDRGEVYGFASWRVDRGLLCLRNPAGTPQTVHATWAATFADAGLAPDAALTLRPVHGPAPAPAARAADPIALPLPPYAVTLLEIRLAPTSSY